MGFKSAWSFYGGKSRIAHRYPKPEYPVIIEPFAGGAGYSLLHSANVEQVILNDLDPKTCEMWRFLQRGDARKWIDQVPNYVEPGQKVDQLGDWPPGLLAILQAEANQGTQGAKGIHNQITKVGARCWPRIRPKLLEAYHKVADWIILEGSYEELNNLEATWFIDPPYQGPAGNRYRKGSDGVDYQALAEWSRSRKGQVIVCEGEGAEWLPFRPLVSRQGIRSKYQQSTRMEMVWTNK